MPALARVRARAVYSRKPDPGIDRFVTGFAFVNEKPRDQQAIGQLLDHVMSPLSMSAF